MRWNFVIKRKTFPPKRFSTIQLFLNPLPASRTGRTRHKSSRLVSSGHYHSNCFLMVIICLLVRRQQQQQLKRPRRYTKRYWPCSRYGKWTRRRRRKKDLLQVYCPFFSTEKKLWNVHAYSAGDHHRPAGGALISKPSYQEVAVDKLATLYHII